MSTLEIMQRARSLSAQAAQLTREQRDRGLECMALALRRRCGAILSANARDVAENGEKLGAVMCDRLALSEQRVSAMAQGLSEIATLPDPLGVALERRPLANGLLLEKQPVPLGVVAIIFESRRRRGTVSQVRQLLHFARRPGGGRVVRVSCRRPSRGLV